MMILTKVFSDRALTCGENEPDWIVFVKAVVGVVQALFWIAVVARTLVVVYRVFTWR
jgi:hypothetical protein